MIIKPEELKIVYEKEDDGRIRPVYFIDVKHGHWKWDRHNGLYYCSECKKRYEYNNIEIMDGEYKYCPNCGSNMDKEEDDETD